MTKIAIVTGASSGLGKEFVQIISLKNEVDEIWVLSRNIDKLQELISEFGNKIRAFSVDLSKLDEIKKFQQRLTEENPEIKLLVNSAGFAKFCSFDDISIDDSINMIDLNISGTVTMGLVCIPFMQKGSHIINIASQASFQPLPYMNIYSATKAFVRNYSRALNIELKEKCISVTAVCPGWMKTNLFERGTVKAKKAPEKFYPIVTPDVVAQKAYKDAMSGKDCSIYGIDVNICHIFTKLLPQKLIMKFWLILQKLN